MEQRLQIARWEKQQRIHRDCGHDVEVCGDKESKWYPQRQICYAQMEEAAARRRYDEQHEDRPYHDGTFPTDPTKWTEDPDAGHPYHYMDGVTILVAETDLYPEDRFLRPRGGLSDTPL